VHLNATRWVAVAGYVRWLGSQGKTLMFLVEKEEILLV